MKYLEEKQLMWLNSILSSYDLGDRVIIGKIEAFSCKKAGSDKKLARSLELQYQQEATEYSEIKVHDIHETHVNKCADIKYKALALNIPTHGQNGCHQQTIGFLKDSSTRKLLINLIATMNASFPDYDFSSLRVEQFYKEADCNVALNRINHYLAEMMDSITVKEITHGRNSSSFAEVMWQAIADIIQPEECEIYSYIPDMDSDPFSDGNLWSFNYFFYNRALRKILYFTCLCKSITCGDETDDDDIMEDYIERITDEDDVAEEYSGISSEWEDGC